MSKLVLPIQSSLGGFFRLQVRRPDGRVRQDTGWFHNVITNVGLTRIGEGSYFTHCHVGTGSSTPSVEDTTLDTFLAATNNTEQSSASAQSSAPYYGQRLQRWRFTPGQATGNLTEVGVGWGNNAIDLFARELIRDAQGDPTAITVLADEFLDVSYQLRLYPPVADVQDQVLDSGTNITHTFTIRAALVTSAADWASPLGANFDFLRAGTSWSMRASDQPIGAITGQPATASGNNTTGRSLVGDPGGNSRAADFTLGLDRANFATGIKSLFVVSRLGAFQYEIDPVIEKDDTQQLTIRINMSWTRHTP